MNLQDSVFSYLPSDIYQEVSRQKKCQMPVWNTYICSHLLFSVLCYRQFPRRNRWLIL